VRKPNYGLDWIDEYERLAEEFYRATGMMAPGKDAPPMLYTEAQDATREVCWQKWLAGRPSPAHEGGTVTALDAGPGEGEHEANAFVWGRCANHYGPHIATGTTPGNRWVCERCGMEAGKHPNPAEWGRPAPPPPQPTERSDK
jgi:hypothetical protein